MFTDTITSKATQLLSNSISTNLAIQNQETFTFKALDPGSNQVVGYSKSYIFTKKLRASFKYAKHIIVKFSGTANDYATINLNLGGNNYNYQSNASYYFAGCYSSIKPDGSFVDFVNYNLDQNINFNNNQVNVKITQHGTCALWTDISVQGSILVQYKQFTDTIRANFDNFNSKLSIPINIKNYDDINISKVENYYCNGNSLTFQPHIYNYKIAYWRVVKSIEIEISGQSDDYAQVIVNNSITVHPNLQDTLGIKDGIYIWGKTQSSDYVKEKHPFTMTNENLNIQFGTVNTLPTVCYLKASLKIRLFFQFTDTIRTTLNSFSTLIRQDLIIGRIVIMIGDDNSDCFKGTWNTDFSVKTVTRATGSIASPISACDLVFFAQNNLQNDSSTGVYYSNGKIGVISAVTNNFKPSIDKPIPTLVYYNYRNFSNPSYYYWYQNRSVLTNLSVLNGTYNFTFDFDYLGKHYSIKKRMIISYQFTDTVKTSVSTFSANLNNKIQLVNIYTIKGNNVAECHVFELVEIWKLLYTLNISVKSKDVEKAYITATLTAEGDDEFIFKLNDSLNMSLPVNAGSCKTCSACGNYTNFYKNSTRTFDVTQYLQDTNSIYVYFHNVTGGYSFKISNLEFTIKTYSKLQFTDTIKVLCNNASKQILISKPFTAPTSTSDRCRQYGYYYGIPIEDFVGSSGAASQTKTFTASDFLYSEHIKKYEVKFACGNGTCVFRINGEIKYNKTMCATCPDRSSGITVSMPVTISSSSSLNSGFAQSAFRVCAFYQFTGTINVLLNKNSVSLKVKRLESLSFSSALPPGACGQTASLNKSFKLSPYIEAGLIKSITVTSNFDDYGSASINVKGVGSCNLGVYQSCYNQTQTSVIDKSNLKNINSLSAYATSWNDPFGSCASNGNATSVYVTIKINYY